MTRAMERLLVSGSVGPPGEGGDETPIGWALAGSGSRRSRAGASEGPWRWSADRRPSSCAWTRDSPTRRIVEDRGSARDGARHRGGQLALFEGSGEALPPPAPRLPRADGGARATLHRVARLSFSALALFERCSYRYYAERVAGMQPTAWSNGEGLGDGERRLARHGDRRRCAPAARARRPGPSDCAGRPRSWFGHGTRPSPSRGSSSSRRWSARTAARRSRSGIAQLDGVQVERPFAFVLDDVLLNGRLDVLWRSGPRARARLQDERPRGS